MTAIEFLYEINKEQITSREFLALIGHTGISNEDYSEIKNNPDMTFERLAEILENSDISGEEYRNLVNTARQRKAAVLQKEKRTALEERLVSALSEKSSVTPPVPAVPIVEATEEINIDINIDDVDEDINFEDISEYEYSDDVDELWGESDFETDADTQADEEYGDEYGEERDFDKAAERENFPKVVICGVLGLVLFFMSFGVRYMTTGSWGITDYALKNRPQSYEEVFMLMEGKFPRNAEQEDSPVFRAEKFGEPRNPLSSVAASDSFLFAVRDGAVCAVGIDSGVLGEPIKFTPPENKQLIGIFEQDNMVYAVAENSPLSSVMPHITVYGFNAVEFTGEFDFEFIISGRFKEVILREDGFFVIGDYSQSGGLENIENAVENPELYMPTVSAVVNNLNNREGLSVEVNNGDGFVVENEPVFLNNVEFISNPEYCNMTVVGSVGHKGGSFDLYAVAGNSADCVYVGDDMLVMSFYSERKDESLLVKYYNLFGGVLSNSKWGSVPGRVRNGFIGGGEFDGIRVASDLGGASAVFLLDSNMGISARSGNVNGNIAGAAFDSKTAYIITEKQGQPVEVYAIGTAGGKAVFLNEPDGLVSDKEFYAWGNDRFFTVEVETDETGGSTSVTAVMYKGESESGAGATVENVKKITLDDAMWDDYIKTPAGESRESVAVSRESGVIMFPVSYFNAVTRVESFFALDYDEETGFSDIGKITEIGVNTKNHAVVIRGGYIYTVWDNVVRSAATDLTVMNDGQF